MARKRCQLAAAGWGTLPSTEREKLHYWTISIESVSFCFIDLCYHDNVYAKTRV